MKEKLIHGMETFGFGLFVPFVRLATRDEPSEQVRILIQTIGVPFVAIVVFGIAWSTLAASVSSTREAGIR